MAEPREFRVVVAKPCDLCPFTRVVPGKGLFLRPARAVEFAVALKQGEGFPCHKTTVCATRRRVPLHCAGAALVLRKEGLENTSMQVAARLGLWQEPKDPDGVVFESLQEFIDHHAGCTSAKEKG